MTTIKLYKIDCHKMHMMSETGTRYALQPWGNNTAEYEGEDDGGKLYSLPGYLQVVRFADDHKEIETTDGHPCAISIASNGNPLVSWYDGRKSHYITLSLSDC